MTAGHRLSPPSPRNNVRCWRRETLWEIMQSLTPINNNKANLHPTRPPEYRDPHGANDPCAGGVWKDPSMERTSSLDLVTTGFHQSINRFDECPLAGLVVFIGVFH